jgi:hypothetical protein
MLVHYVHSKELCSWRPSTALTRTCSLTLYIPGHLPHRRFLSGSARHTSKVLKQKKLSLSWTIDELEAITEVRPLTTQQIDLKSQYNANLVGLLREEELKWYQRSKAQSLLEGNMNTRYFPSVANGRHMKKLFHSLVQEEGTIYYHKWLFGVLKESTLFLDEFRIDDIPQVFP